MKIACRNSSRVAALLAIATILSAVFPASSPAQDSAEDQCYVRLVITRRDYENGYTSLALAQTVTLRGDLSASVIAPDPEFDTYFASYDSARNALGITVFMPGSAGPKTRFVDDLAVPVGAGRLVGEKTLTSVLPYAPAIRSVEFIGPNVAIPFKLDGEKLICPPACVKRNERGRFGPSHCCGELIPKDIGGGAFVCQG